MDLMALLGLCVFVALIFFVLNQFGGELPPLILKIIYVVLVIVVVLALCSMLGIPLPSRLGAR